MDLNCIESDSRCCSLQSPKGILEDYTTVKVCGDPLKNKEVPAIPDVTEGNIEGWLFSCTGFPPLPPRSKGNKLLKFNIKAIRLVTSVSVMASSFLAVIAVY